MGWRPSLGLTFYFYLVICIGDVTGVTEKWIATRRFPPPWSIEENVGLFPREGWRRAEGWSPFAMN
jgi:hypothetical protein